MAYEALIRQIRSLSANLNSQPVVGVVDRVLGVSSASLHNIVVWF